MPTPVWQPGTIYPPGSLVQPASAPPPQPDPLDNGGFEEGNTGWSMDAGFSIGEFGNGTHFQGTWSLQWDLTGEGRAINAEATEVTPGQTITGSCQVQQGASSSGQAGARVEILWYDVSDEFLSSSTGNMVNSTSNQNWKQSSVSAVAPAGAAFARFAVYAFRTSGGDELWVDNCTWDAVIASLPTGLVFRAVQATAGYSGSSEPAWPLVQGQQVVDNEVTWEAVFASRVVWEATPVLVSGEYEPTWPTTPDGEVADGTIRWVAMDWRVTDEKCPQGPVVAIGASKVFCADDDIIAFSATTNPLDWSAEEDAGFLPFGLQTYGSNPVAALGLYRSNLLAFNSEGYQMWQIDEDPASMAFLDASPVPCTFPKSGQPVSNDFAMVTPVGIRSIGIAGASTNLQAGYFGAQIDPLVLAKIQAGEAPISLTWPAAGQFWAIFGDEAFVLTMNGGTKDWSWSRYVFPDAITDWAILNDDLYLRAGNYVWRMDPEALADDAPTPDQPLVPVITPIVECDPDFIDVSLLLHADGTNGSTAFVDSSDNAFVVTASGNAQITTTDPKFGTGSLLLDGTDHVSVPITASGPLDLAQHGDFTIEFWMRSSTLTTQNGIIVTFGDRLTAPNLAITLFVAAGQFQVDPSVATGWGGMAPVIAYQNDTWTHVAVVREGSQGRLYINGVQQGAAVNDWTGSFSVSPTLQIGNGFPGEPFFGGFVGQVDEFRVTTGVCRYTSNFTPATEAFGDAQCAEVPDVIGLSQAAAIAAIEAEGLVNANVALATNEVVAEGVVIDQSPDAATATITGTDVNLLVSRGPTTAVPFEGYIAWPYLDFGLLGIDKMLEGFDIVADGTFRVSFGYSQRDFSLATAEYAIDGDTLTGGMVPMPLTAPSFQFRLTFDGSQEWEWFAANLYCTDTGTG